MSLRAKLALCEPDPEFSNRYFTFKLKADHLIEPNEYRGGAKLLIVTNVQGDFIAFRALLLRAKVMDKDYHWTFGDGHLVIAGNCLGEGGKGIECLWLAYALEQKARKAFGYVHFILGRNEIENINGDWQYKQPKYAVNKRTSRSHYVVLYNGNNELRRWLQTKNIIERIDGMLISSIDLRAEITEPDQPLNRLNRLARGYYYQSYNINLGSEEFISKLFYHIGVKTSHIGYKLVPRKLGNYSYVFTNSKNEECDSENTITGIDFLLVKNGQFYTLNPAPVKED